MPNFGAVVAVVLLLALIAAVSDSQSSYVCPKKFVPIGKKCYHFSKDEAIWLDAHFRCSSLNSTLAKITGSHQELRLRRFLSRRLNDKHERWLGGRFNEKQRKWVWGENGKPLGFHGFSRLNVTDKRWAFHCIILDPARWYKWSARKCILKRRYVCQRRSYLKRNPRKKECNKNPSNNTTKICSNNNVDPASPGFLVKKPKMKYKPYQPTTFICPSHMILVGRKCYFFSRDEANWSDAYWACRDNNTKLANIVTKLQDNILRGFLNENFTERHERWIDGIYDWKQMKWKWAMSGREIKYKNFAKAAVAGTKHIQHCITLDPQFNHLWNSRNRLEKKHYICQAKAKSVVKYDKIHKFKPDATVIIQDDKSDKSFTIGPNPVTQSRTPSTPAHYQNRVNNRYVYNN